MAAADASAAVILLNGLITQLDRDAPLSLAFSQHAAAALQAAAQALQHGAVGQPSQLRTALTKLVELTCKRLGRGQVCVRCCGVCQLPARCVRWRLSSAAVTLLERS
jgi:hypothetical protein